LTLTGHPISGADEVSEDDTVGGQYTIDLLLKLPVGCSDSKVSHPFCLVLCRVSFFTCFAYWFLLHCQIKDLCKTLLDDLSNSIEIDLNCKGKKTSQYLWQYFPRIGI
jgi:hypothetical protein